MRYFRRVHPPDVIWAESASRPARRILAPHDGEDGTLTVYDDSYPDEAQWADQMAGDAHYVEVDAHDDPLTAVEEPDGYEPPLDDPPSTPEDQPDPETGNTES